MRTDRDDAPLVDATNATAHAAAIEHLDAQHLPHPAKARWHPLRSGLLNLYRYDEQEFWFEQGRLLLRGNNGTGKSRVLALQLPFLLDGEIAPHRVEPDRDPAKRMEWNLLMNRHNDRLGYTWIEFGRLLADGSESFLTLGCGLRAVQGKGIDDRWFFITPLRVGTDFLLASEGRNPLSRERLEQVVGRDRVYRQAREYRRAVDEALFKLGVRYEPLIELLIRLRQPQLSRQLDESALSRALSEALAPLPLGLIDETAEAFRGLEADRDDLAGVRMTHAGVQEFLGEYRGYIRAAARRRAEAVRRANSAFESAGRRLREATQRRDEAAAACAQLKSEINANEDRQVALQATIRALEESPEMRGARELEHSRQEADRCANARTQAEQDTQVALAAEQQAQQEHGEVCDKAADVDRQSASALATAARHAALAAFAEPHAAAIAALGELDTSSSRIDSVRRGLDIAVQQRLSTIAHLSRLQADLSHAMQTAAESERALNDAATELGEAREREQAARLALESATEQVVDDFVAWHAGLQELAIADPDSLIDEFRVWAERAEGGGPLQDAAEAARHSADRAVTQEYTRVEMQERDQAARAGEIAVEIERLESGVHVPPAPPHTRVTARDGRPGAPLWQLCDFRSETSAAVRAGVEAALEASGLLDAWVYPDGVVVDPATRDTLLIVSRAAGAPVGGDVPARATSNVWLEPVAAANQGGSVPVSTDIVRGILDAIGTTPGAGEYWATDDGAWQLGPLRGSWSKSAAEHIGEASRAAARRRQAARLRQELELVQEERARLREMLEHLDARRMAIAAEYEASPLDAGLRQAGFALAHRVATVATALDRLQKAEEKSSAARHAVERARQRRDADAADTRLAAWVERLDDLRDAFGSYREALSAVWPQLRLNADVQLQRERSAARLAAAQSTHQERAARRRQTEIAAHEAASRYRALHATVGASADAILLQHGATVQSLENAKVLGKSLAAQERDRDLERERAAADIDRHAADHLRHEMERRDAIDRLAAFSLRRLLGEADSAFASLDLSGEWSPTRGVDLARRAETVLADTPSDDEAWRRHQESIHQHITILRDQLIPRGHQPEEHLLEDVVVVQCPFQGGLCTMTELAAILSGDLAARARLLDEKEREVIENHLLGEVVLELQKLVLEAEKWVGATNEQLASRPTSTGMLLRFQWEPDPDGPDGLDSVRRQLLRTRDLWTPEERRGLAEFLQTRIREARDENEIGTWRDYLNAALDYRKWHRFAVERHQDGQWRRLTRRTYGTGSGGEKALALTLPQFAAAAAHYQSADPAAPRLILLDEVFVGIDSEMRANCMGLLESFDLDFIMTSEREWGCYPTLSGLGIYQLSSRAGIDAVACTRWVWNGHQMLRAAAPPVRSVPLSRQAADSLSLPFDSPPNEPGP